MIKVHLAEGDCFASQRDGGPGGVPPPTRPAPTPRPTPATDDGHSSGGHSGIFGSEHIWIYVARLFAAMAVCATLACLTQTVAFVCKGRDARKREALADLLQYAEAPSGDDWSVTEEDRNLEAAIEMSLQAEAGQS